jgi:crossover junction endodeoxyribonuclease RuvC
MGYGIIRICGKKAEMLALGVIDLRKYGDHYMKLGHIFDRITGIIDSYLPDEMAIEAPFFGKNVQSMLKLGRAQGVAMAAAIQRQVPITEYAPMKIKMAITGIALPQRNRWQTCSDACCISTRKRWASS